jgi:glutamine amidotransferase-like uncharacterized protein
MRRLAFLIFVLPCLALAQPKSAVKNSDENLALIYKGPGSCPEQCSESAAHVAELAGLTPVYVGPKANNISSLLARARIWIQPGGHSSEVAKVMPEEMKNAIRSFVAGGGAYVGFCAGGFYAGESFHDDEKGLGLIPGKSLYQDHLAKYDNGVVIEVSWLGKLRDVYWEGGPYFVLRSPNAFEITASYADGRVAGLRGPYGQGRVAVTGFHPEAPLWWRKDVPGTDRDGLDEDIAVGMIDWAIAVKKAVNFP